MLILQSEKNAAFSGKIAQLPVHAADQLDWASCFSRITHVAFVVVAKTVVVVK